MQLLGKAMRDWLYRHSKQICTSTQLAQENYQFSMTVIGVVLISWDVCYEIQIGPLAKKALEHFSMVMQNVVPDTVSEPLKVVHHRCQAIAFMFNGGSCSNFYTIDTKICVVLVHYLAHDPPQGQQSYCKCMVCIGITCTSLQKLNASMVLGIVHLGPPGVPLIAVVCVLSIRGNQFCNI